MCEHGYRVRGMLAARSTSGNRKQTPRRLITPFVLASVPNLPLCPSLAPCRAGENAHRMARLAIHFAPKGRLIRTRRAPSLKGPGEIADARIEKRSQPESPGVDNARNRLLSPLSQRGEKDERRRLNPIASPRQRRSVLLEATTETHTPGARALPGIAPFDDEARQRLCASTVADTMSPCTGVGQPPTRWHFQSMPPSRDKRSPSPFHHACRRSRTSPARPSWRCSRCCGSPCR